ncbi:Calpain family cysteine protease [Pirellula sp. SH-Sr6A]|uniref:C2 family cysteine protease n=1 Tax=Pirellula sp. SH-Sr6A TaxID=1632865 RepID=UPI00078E77FC|nr:C2 family cysteine protease [Pirellula sp. SH-Sr6A]AMV35486.1 Calpain family cysteine protease [Pirellula sp. SH-Sr6A]
MFFSSSSPHQKNRKIKTTPLGLEQLESRLLNAVDGMEALLAAAIPQDALGHTFLVASQNVRSTNTAPRVQTAPKLQTGTEVKGTSARLIVQGTDDQGESKLTYTWSVLSAPVGGSATFDINGTNKAKGVTATFTRAGQYQFRVLITDQAGLTSQSTLRVQVVQVPTAVQAFSIQGSPLTDPLQVTTTSQSISIRATDQFGQPISRLATLSWSAVKQPSNGKFSAMNGNTGTNLQFTSTGTYSLKVASGNASLIIQANVIPTLTSIGIQDSNKVSIRSANAISLPKSQARFHAVGLDQFGNPLKSQPVIDWAFPSKPNGSQPVVQATANRADMQFDRVGSYTVRATSGTVQSQITVSLGITLSRIELLDAIGDVLPPKAQTTTSTRTQQFTVRGFDQFGQSISALPSLTWTTVKAPNGGQASGTLSRTTASLTFTAPGIYSLKVAGGTAVTAFQVNVERTSTTLEAINASNSVINPRVPLTTTGTSVAISLRSVDQFGKPFTAPLSATWSVVSGPNGNNAQFSTVRGVTTITFDRAGSYTVRASAGNSSVTFNVQVAQRIATLHLSPGSASLDAGARLQFRAEGLDQFGNPITSLGAVTWSATGGSISSGGLFQAGVQGNTFQVTARIGQLSASMSGTIVAAGAHSSLTNSALRSLVSSLHADSSISRLEMIQILRSVGTDGVVGSDELADLRLLVSSNSGFLMPTYVRELARDVVQSNPANSKFRGQTAGNLSVGSSATLLNNLIDKWFLGADLPLIAGGGISYQTANGVLFSGTPSRVDALQGYLGDCYFIASITSIADQTPAAVQNMFLDNGDGTFTVRFFGPTSADYITVNRQLPALSSGVLAYAGLGKSVSSATTPLWVALAEKAYAQWNETGLSGRDGTNTYAGIEGGWMSNVNRQVLGYASSNYAVSTSSASHLASQLGGGRAVTIGTKGNVSNGLVGSHAYIVTGYDAGTGTFDLYNPWGTTHPGPLTWSQIQANCDFYAVTDSAGTSGISTLSVRSSVSETTIGNWTTVVMTPIDFLSPGTVRDEITRPDDSFENRECNDLFGTFSWVTPDQSVEDPVDPVSRPALCDSFEEGPLERKSFDIENDLAFTLEHIEDLLGSI